jgi:hypothetical protein
MLLDGKRTTGLGEFTNRELLGVAVGYGQKEEGLNLTSFDPAAIFDSIRRMPRAFLQRQKTPVRFTVRAKYGSSITLVQRGEGSPS